MSWLRRESELTDLRRSWRQAVEQLRSDRARDVMSRGTVGRDMVARDMVARDMATLIEAGGLSLLAGRDSYRWGPFVLGDAGRVWHEWKRGAKGWTWWRDVEGRSPSKLIGPVAMRVDPSAVTGDGSEYMPVESSASVVSVVAAEGTTFTWLSTSIPRTPIEARPIQRIGERLWFVRPRLVEPILWRRTNLPRWVATTVIGRERWRFDLWGGLEWEPLEESGRDE